MKRNFLVIAVLLMALLVLSTGCQKAQDNTDIPQPYHNDEFPSFVVEDVTVPRGKTEATVQVKLTDNPGFLTMAMTVEYDASVFYLNEICNGSDYAVYNFVGPKDKSSGCIASWFIPELPEKVVDGTLAELHFSLPGNAKPGKYPITISRPDNGGIVDENKNTLVINNAVGYIVVEE